MRNRLFTTVAALLLVSGAAMAQDDKGSGSPQQTAAAGATTTNQSSEFGLTNQIDFGIRGTFFGDGSDQAVSVNAEPAENVAADHRSPACSMSFLGDQVLPRSAERSNPIPWKAIEYSPVPA